MKIAQTDRDFDFDERKLFDDTGENTTLEFLDK